MKSVSRVLPVVRRMALLLPFVALLAAAGSDRPGEHRALAAESQSAAAARVEFALPEEQLRPAYADWRSRILSEEGAVSGEESVVVPASQLSSRSPDADATTGEYEGKDGVLLWMGGTGSWIEYDVTVEQAGWYEIHVSYLPYQDSAYRRPVVWSVTLDGAYPFRETSSVGLYRQWRDVWPIRQDEQGNDIRPRSEDVSEWSERPLVFTGGSIAGALQWFFEAGTHAIRFTGGEPVALETIRLVPPAELPAYADVRSSIPADDAAAEAEPIEIEAERPMFKSDSAIQIASDSDVLNRPEAKGNLVFNTIGGERWWSQNQELTWSFEIERAGRYNIGMRALQNFIFQKASIRSIAIDGIVPFQEMKHYRFPYRAGWQGVVLETEAGEPFDFYFEPGTHTLTMTVTHEPFTSVMTGIEEAAAELYAINQDLLALTGGQNDLNRTWRIERDLPELPQQVRAAADRLGVLAEQVRRINGRTDNVSQGLLSSELDLRSILDNPDTIPYHIDRISSIRERISLFLDTMIQQPLQLDRIFIVPAEQPFPRMEASFWESMQSMIMSLLYSFRNTDAAGTDENTLDVWVLRGRDYVSALQELADETFTPETGIDVRINLLPSPELLILSNAAGTQPDVALGLAQELPVDYAIRDSVYDLSSFPDFAKVFEQFAPGSWLPYFYNGGYYAMPETQSFNVLYYRKDILERLELSIPQTWQDVYDMLSVLQQNEVNFYVPPKEYVTFFYQNGANFFTPDGMETDLDSPESFRAFKQWTDLFNIYAIDQEVPSFYEHFRRGSMPIGIADYNMYVSLLAAAPELNGWWGIAPLPGTLQEDGSIARWSGGLQTAGVMFKSSRLKDESWQFLKWWMSTETQERYGTELEAFNGVAFRWNTANVEAFTRLPWKPEDANIILQQWSWYKELPNVPGSYFVPREIGNAWNRTVVDGMNYRASLEQTNLEISREMRRKQQEFGHIDQYGNVIDALDLPVVDTPWEGVNRFVSP